MDASLFEVSYHSCVACRKLKRKCSKDFPSCSLCRRVGRTCEYPPQESLVLDNRRTTSTHDQIDGLVRSSLTSSPRQHAPADHVSESQPHSNLGHLQTWFLDSVLSRGMRTNVSTSLLWSEVTGVEDPLTISEARAISDEYFRSIHLWFPIVSVRRISMRLDALVSLDCAHDAILFVAMRLLLKHEHNPHVQQNLYKSLKLGLAECESRGELNTDFLASQIITALYEVSSGIFPDAYFTVGACYRTCCALGLHNKRVATQLGPRPETWGEIEERRRLWWASLILDRYLNIGFLFRPLSHPAIDPNEALPAQDQAWDKGSLSPNPLLIMSLESQTLVSAYARTCQAAHLLGRTCQHINEHVEPSDSEFHLREAQSLQQALLALLSLLQEEVTTTDTPCQLFSAIGLCFSALLVLSNVHSCIDDEYVSPGSNRSRARDKGMRIELQEMSIAGRRSLTATILQFVDIISRELDMHGPGTVSPFLLHGLYQAGKSFAWYARESGDQENLISLERIRDILKLLQTSWKVAASYLRLLEGTEYLYEGPCPI